MNGINLKNIFPNPNFYFCFFTDRKKIDLTKVISHLSKKTLVIFREYDLKYQERLYLAKKIQKICQKKDLKLIIGKDLSLAKEISVNAIHFSDRDDFLSNFNQIKDKFFISCAFHSKESALKFQDLNFDIRFLSPIFKTDSHLNQKPIGINILKELTEDKNIKICPLGGINMDNIQQLQNLNISGIAGINLFNPNPTPTTSF